MAATIRNAQVSLIPIFILPNMMFPRLFGNDRVTTTGFDDPSRGDPPDIVGNDHQDAYGRDVLAAVSLVARTLSALAEVAFNRCLNCGIQHTGVGVRVFDEYARQPLEEALEAAGNGLARFAHMLHLFCKRIRTVQGSCKSVMQT
ncbi:hypothetical protein [Xanthomonas cerealis]|uniref:hypothetical protein n=1 Tax=Xanthomonas cerealis TaxID=3390025 RepID=UPI00159EF737|nr:hypothetical protein [Xanthomonas translucens]UKE49129.1 hypothetical protein KHA79_12725 [Xanthomonas translucens pv. cerealis]